MKQHIITTAILLIITACSDNFLDRKIQGALDIDTYFTTDDAAMKLVANCYAPMLDGFPYSINRVALFHETVDDADCGGSDPGDRPQTSEIGRGRPLASNALLAECWQQRYKAIGRCNSAIENLSADGLNLLSNGQTVDKNTIARYIAEVKFLRAWYYFDLVNTFATIPIITTTLTPSQRPPKNTLEEIRTQLYDDLDDAINNPNLPMRKNLPPEQLGRITKEAAKTLKARIALFFAGLITQNKMKGDPTAEYNTAKQLTGQIINESQLSLLPDFQDLYKGDYTTAPQSTEAILIVPRTYKPEITFSGDPFCIMNAGRNNVGGWGGCCPTKNLAEEYEINDPRKQFTIISDGDIFKDKNGQEEIHNYKGYYNDYNLQQSRKCFIPQAYRNATDLTRTNWTPYWIRYPEVLLIHAEANEHTNGDKNITLQCLNTIRHRAFVTTSKKDQAAIYRKFEPEPTNITTEEFNNNYAIKETDNLLQAIKHERRVELALEGLRLYDLVRTGEYTQTMQNFYKKYHFADKGINAADNSWPFPIPQAEIDRSNGALQQNPNY